MHRRKLKAVLWILALLLAAMACQFPLRSDIDRADMVATTVAGTMTAAAPDAAPPDQQPGTNDETQATETPPQGPTATAAASVNLTRGTNCRTGPFRFYDHITTILEGEQVDVLGKNDDGNYWYIVHEEKAPDGCWLWGRYAEVSGEPDAVPLFTPPPTPEYLWTGDWTIWVDDDLKEGTLELSQAGGRLDGTARLDGETDQLAGTISDDDRTVEGEVTTTSGVRFNLMMLENKNQFIGSFTGPDSQGNHPLCGAREDEGQPDPCLWP